MLARVSGKPGSICLAFFDAANAYVNKRTGTAADNPDKDAEQQKRIHCRMRQQNAGNQTNAQQPHNADQGDAHAK